MKNPVPSIFAKSSKDGRPLAERISEMIINARNSWIEERFLNQHNGREEKTLDEIAKKSVEDRVRFELDSRLSTLILSAIGLKKEKYEIDYSIVDRGPIFLAVQKAAEETLGKILAKSVDKVVKEVLADKDGAIERLTPSLLELFENFFQNALHRAIEDKGRKEAERYVDDLYTKHMKGLLQEKAV